MTNGLTIHGDKAAGFFGSFDDDGTHGGYALAACPFCGFTELLKLNNTHTPCYWVECDGCGCEGPQAAVYGPAATKTKAGVTRQHQNQIARAVNLWNTRNGKP